MARKAKENKKDNSDNAGDSPLLDSANIDVKKMIQPKGLYFTRPVMGHYLSTKDEIREGANIMFEKVKLGKIKIEIFKKYK